MSKGKTAEYAGHGISDDGSWDPGCTYKKKGKTYTEAALVLDITKSFVAYSKGSGISVISDIPKNNINMNNQIIMSNKAGCKVHIAIHCDWEKAESGTLPLFVSDEGRKLAVCLNKSVMAGMGMRTRGVCKRTDLKELNATNAVAVIFECGSIKADLKKMQNADAYGKYLAKGLCNYYGIKFTGKKK